jgi:hypothetical protein
MRVAVWRRLAMGLLLLLVVGVGAPAQVPGDPPKLVPVDVAKLKADLAALAGETKTTEEANAGTRAALQAELKSLIKAINDRPSVAPSPRPPGVSPSPGTKIESGGKFVDELRFAMNLFRDGDYEAARQAFQRIDPKQLVLEDRAFARYMTACCLRLQGKVAEAEVIYREVADAKEDEFVAGCAIWQLALIRSNRELQTQLEVLRARAKTK